MYLDKPAYLKLGDEISAGPQNVDGKKTLTCTTDYSKLKAVISWQPDEIENMAHTTYLPDQYGGHAANSVVTFMLTKPLA